MRQQYFWHRFFSHQPDLNYENPAVQEAMLDVLRFWLDLGIDGFRLDAVPYLFEGEGTNGENLPETHEFLKRVRKEVDASTPAASCWARRTSGRRTSSSTSATEAAATSAIWRSTSRSCRASSWPCAGSPATRSRRSSRKTPPIPDGCQWGIFLRNHDELTLEMVTDDERDYMYEEYAKDPRMQANIGIRRRLAPLLENDRNQIELFTLCCSRCPARRCSTTATRSAWATTSGSATATACAPRCSGRRPQRRVLHGRPGGSTCRRSWTRSTATRRSTSRRRCATRARC